MEELTGESWQGIGLVGVLALLLVREVLSFLRDQRNGHNNLGNEISRLQASITTLNETLVNVIIETRATRQEVGEIRRDLDEVKERLR